MAKIVAVTACPTGIAHTIMAAEGLEQAAKILGHDIQVETQGSVGTRNTLSDDAIAAADVVIIAADTRVDTARFADKPIYETATEPAIRDGAAVIQAALASAPAPTAAPAAAAAGLKIVGITSCPTGIAHTFMAAEGLEQGAKSQGHTVKVETQGSVGAKPGMIGGMIASAIGSGFLGGIAAGFLAGYVVKFISDHLPLPRTLVGLKPILILPLLGTTIVSLLMYYVVGEPMAAALGISLITEGAIPYAAKDPLWVILALMIGSAVTGAIAMVAGCELRVPHGGVFVLPIPSAVTNLGPYLIAIVAGTLVTTAALFFLKRPLEAKAPVKLASAS